MSKTSWKREILIGGLGSVVGALILGTFGVLSNWGKNIVDIDVDSGAVIAFDTATCPDGWDNLVKLDQRKFAGRLLVIAGPQTIRNPPEHSTMARNYNGNGGEGGQESVKLEISHMPSHDHGGIWGGTGEKKMGMRNEHQAHTSGYKQIEAQGAGKPHENMPPFVALIFCKKR